MPEQTPIELLVGIEPARSTLPFATSRISAVAVKGFASEPSTTTGLTAIR